MTSTYPDEDIDIILLGEWGMSLDGTTEHRRLIGRSDAGFHWCVERSYLGRDEGVGPWSAALTSYADAIEGGEQALDRIDECEQLPRPTPRHPARPSTP